MMDLTINTDTLAQYIDGAHTLVDEAKIHVTDDGLETRATEAANVGMVDETLAPGAFDAYNAGDGKVLGVNLGRLADIVSMGDSGDVWQITESDRKILMQSRGLEYSMATIDPDSIRQEPDIPDLELPAEARVEWARVDRALTAADMVSDHVAIGTEAGDGGIYLSAEGDTDDVHETIAGDDLADDSIIPTEDSVESLFSLDYLKSMKKPIPKDAVATIRFGQEFPIKILWGTEHMDVTYMLAPRVQS